ncbi:MAG: GNAT family N-acetyltransferase [Candidatus Limnocylindrales bacterium]
MASIVDSFPVLGLRITAGNLVLHGIDDETLAELIELARCGVHPPDRMPFKVPWTDTPPDRFALSFAQYHWGVRTEFSPTRWRFELAVRWHGELVGAQGFATRNYLVTRTGETGSWLGLAHQGRGIGTRMRQAMCAFVFDCLEAQEITSAAFVDNPASHAVSRKVGYRPNGMHRAERRPGELAVQQKYVLTPEALVRGPEITVEGLAPVRRLIGLEA